MSFTNRFSRSFRWIWLSSLSGLLAGLSAAVFLLSLRWVTEIREANPFLIWFLPIGGFFIGWVYFRFGKDIAAGNNLIIDEIHDPRNVTPPRMAPLILLGTLITHLFGGSAGREGTVVQMGASLSDQLSRIFRVGLEERKILLVAGAGAGFGAAIGAPWAGVIFGMEVIHVGRLRLFAWFQCLISSFVAFGVTRLLRAPHSDYLAPTIPDLSFSNLLWVVVAGCLFGLMARSFCLFTHRVEGAMSSWIRFPPLKPFLGGVALVVLFYGEASYRYVGLGIPVIQEAFAEAASFKDPVLKAFFTAVTVGTGFKGGEFMPLVFIGATLGSALSLVVPLSVSFLAALGFAAVFGGASNTPIACTLMAMEVFGYRIGPFAFIACFMSYYFSGHKGIYKAQRVRLHKRLALMAKLRFLRRRSSRFFR